VAKKWDGRESPLERMCKSDAIPVISAFLAGPYLGPCLASFYLKLTGSTKAGSEEAERRQIRENHKDVEIT
jgi:hypothetical protein